MPHEQQGGATSRAGHLIWVGWMVVLLAAAWLLPPLDSPRIEPHPVAAAVVVAACALFLIITCISLYRYFRAAWSKWRTVPNRTEYVVWISLETLAAIAVIVAAIWGYVRL